MATTLHYGTHKPVAIKKPKIAFGVETEFAIYPVDKARAILCNIFANRDVFKVTRGQQSQGITLPTGGSMYLDSGDHLEHCSPECSNPKDLIAYTKLGEEILLAAATKVHTKVYRYNVNYLVGSRRTWGIHENYYMGFPVDLHRFSTRELHAASRSNYMDTIFLPHLLSRIIYTGAGGIKASGSTLQFRLSPRVDFQAGAQYNIKPSVHVPGFRFHVVCGDNNYSELSNYLKIATTSLLVLAYQAGEFDSNDIIEINNILEICSNSLSITLQHREREINKLITKRSFKDTRALKLQRYYLNKVISCLDKEYMPDWAAEACKIWGAILNDLEKNVERVADKLDWAIKYNVFKSYIKERKSGNKYTLRNEVSEMDMNFGLFGPEGIFNNLDAAGLLNDKIISPEYLAEARTRGPYGTRAWIRAQIIQKIDTKYRTKSSVTSDWGAYLISGRIAHIIDLSDVTNTRVTNTERKWLLEAGITLIPSRLASGKK